MSEQNPVATPNDARESSLEDLCNGALRHYDELSTKACSWMNQIPLAIRFWYLEKPALERELQSSQSDCGRLKRERDEANEQLIAILESRVDFGGKHCAQDLVLRSRLDAAKSFLKRTANAALQSSQNSTD